MGLPNKAISAVALTGDLSHGLPYLVVAAPNEVWTVDSFGNLTECVWKAAYSDAEARPKTCRLSSFGHLGSFKPP